MFPQETRKSLLRAVWALKVYLIALLDSFTFKNNIQNELAEQELANFPVKDEIVSVLGL